MTSQLPDDDDLSDAKFHSVHLRNRDRCDALKQGGAVHVHRGPEGKHQVRDLFVHAVVVQAFHGNREGSGAAVELSSRYDRTKFS